MTAAAPLDGQRGRKGKAHADSSNPDSYSVGSWRNSHSMYSLHPCAGGDGDGQLCSPREKSRSRGRELLERRSNRHAGDIIRSRGPPGRDCLVGGCVPNVRRIYGVRSRVLPLRGQLHHLGLWRPGYDAGLEVTGPTRSSRWNAHVRGFDRDNLCSHSTIDSRSVCRPQGVRLRPNGTWLRSRSRLSQPGITPPPTT